MALARCRHGRRARLRSTAAVAGVSLADFMRSVGVYDDGGADPAKETDKFTVRDFRTDCLRELKKSRTRGRTCTTLRIWLVPQERLWPNTLACELLGRIDGR